jgi:hypothetical protein
VPDPKGGKQHHSSDGGLGLVPGDSMWDLWWLVMGKVFL